ncbi:MAG: hypothetical protein OEV31_04550 [Gammaproteobacteria bacterium]|nr:hypothetical protein [Gammaproteobacteria bacterium]
MSGFLLVGIVVNVLLTGLAIYWVVRNMKSGSSRRDDEKDGDNK